MHFINSIVVLLCIVILQSCGSDKPEEAAAPAPSGPVVDIPAGDKISYQQMQTHIVGYCQSCHANDPFVKSEAQLRSSAAKLRLSNKTMPPSFAPKKLPDNIRTQMIGFF